MKHLKFVLPFLLLLVLSGCGGPAVMLASAALSGLGGVVGGSGSSGMERTGNPYSYRSPNMASEVQNGHRVDESIPQALQTSDQDVTSACRARLPEESNLPLDAGECEIRMTCLPGAEVPMRLRMCMPPDSPSTDEANAEASAISRSSDQAL